MRVGGPTDFWKVLKSVSVAEIAREANRPITIAIVGPPDRRALAIAALYAPDSNVAPNDEAKSLALPEQPFVQAFDSTSTEAGFPTQPGVFDFVIDVGTEREDAPDGILIYSVVELGGWDNALDRIFEDQPHLTLPLARNFPAFRKRAAQRIIGQTATANAQFSLVTGIAEAIPITAILLPVNALSDIVILTKNQTMMVLRLAAAHGLPIDYKSRMKEVGPILANAFGWRAIARELVGAVPGVGFVARAMISYAGTATVGKAAQLYYETGETVTAGQMKRLYREAYETGQERVKAMAENLRISRKPEALTAASALTSGLVKVEEEPIDAAPPPVE